MANIPANTTICLITPGHIASNPRLVKEAIALVKAGFKVHIVFTQYVNYLVQHDKMILAANPLWTYDQLNWTTGSLNTRINRLISGLKQKLPGAVPVKLNRNYAWQVKKSLACNAALYIAHNLGALPVAVAAAKKNKAKCGFDAEDFHRNETSDDGTDGDVQLKIEAENIYIPQIDYFTAASPLIAQHYQQLYHKTAVPVLNVFPKTSLPVTRHTENAPLQLFWFSQTIGPNRGLETIIEAIGITYQQFNLHLLGHVTDGYKTQLQRLAIVNAPQLKMVFHTPVFMDEIFDMAARYDIGLATEPQVPLNRNICLTNKLFTYIQAGLAVIASNTTAQNNFMQKYPETGQLYHTVDQMAKTLLMYSQNRTLLQQTKSYNFNLGQTVLNWDVESRILIQQVKQTLLINNDR